MYLGIKKRRLPFILLNFLNHTIILGFINSPKIKIDRKFGLFLGTSGSDGIILQYLELAKHSNDLVFQFH